MTDIDNTPELAWVGTRESRPMPGWGLVEMAVLLAAVIGRLPALGAWWALDDWGLLGRAAGILNERRDEISDLITAECGLSKKDSLYEVGRAFDVYTLSGNMCIHDDGEVFSCDLTPHGKQRKIFTQREPLTAISAITPFNHPLNMISHKIAPAIATNNCIVCKPTELTPLTALLLADVLYEAGLPPEMLSVVTGLPSFQWARGSMR